MHVSNSPFFQSPSEKDLKASALSRPAYQYQQLRRKIGQATSVGAEAADASIYVGFAANGPDQTTAGQVSGIRWQITPDELYASWIGNALAARVEGSQCLLLDSEPVLWHLYEGWQVYRNYMRPVQRMDGRQIETWNGYWLAKGDKTRAPDPPIKGTKVETYPWVEVIARLLEWHAGEILPVYVFSLGQTNTTYGFINIHLPQVKRLREARHAIKRSVMTAQDSDDNRFWEKYVPELSLREVCQMGEIGLRGLRPMDYTKLMEGTFSATKINDKNRNTFLNIEIWIMAMLQNKTELQKLAADLATELVNAESASSGKIRAKTTDATESKKLFEAKGLTSFISALTDLLEKRSDAKPVCRAVADQSIRIPFEHFPLFKALLRFEYVYRKND